MLYISRAFNDSRVKIQINNYNSRKQLKSHQQIDMEAGPLIQI